MVIQLFYVSLIIIALVIGVIIFTKSVNTRTCPECKTKIENKNATKCPKCGNPLK